MAIHVKRKVQAPKGDINVTPLVDVCLVLLIIFMVVTPMLTRGKDVRLPVTDNHKTKKEEKNQITVTVTRDGKIFWEQDQVTDQELEAKIRDTHVKDPGRQIVLKGDDKAPYKWVRRVMKLINAGGYETVNVITKEREGKKGS